MGVGESVEDGPGEPEADSFSRNSSVRIPAVCTAKSFPADGLKKDVTTQLDDHPTLDDQIVLHGNATYRPTFNVWDNYNV